MNAPSPTRGVSRGHVLIALAVLIAGAAIMFALRGESCESWKARESDEQVNVWAGIHGSRTLDDIRAQRPEGC